MGMPRAIEKGKRTGPVGIASRQVITTGQGTKNLGASKQYNQTGPKNTAPNYKQKDKGVVTFGGKC